MLFFRGVERRVGHGHRNKERRRAMSSRHLSCSACRIRVLASAPGTALLEGRCPICGVTLTPACSALGVLGLRSFSLDAFAENPEERRADSPGACADFVLGLQTATALARLDADFPPDGGEVVARENAVALAAQPPRSAAPGRA
jgi:hypothetical protein